ncbi:MAG: cupin domain-containing protein [Acidobacteriota bacterium]|nr:cupin domain-containing protein [Acidobacteriota bacterium]
MKLSVADLFKQLPQPPSEKYPEGVPFVAAFRHGTMSIELFAPRGADLQTPHEQDEIYVVVSGSGEFVRNGERINFTTGDLLFVPAGMPHRFENFSANFATWVIFYGAKGGENNL